MKIFVTLLSFLCIFPLFSAEKITFGRYKELIRGNYPNLYNYRPGRVFLRTENIISNYTPEGSDKIFVCKYSSQEKDTILQATRFSNSYYELVEKWIEPSWDINSEEGKVCEKGNFGFKKGEEDKFVFLVEMPLPPFIRPDYNFYTGTIQDFHEHNNFYLDNDGLVIEECPTDDDKKIGIRTVFDLSRPMAFAEKFRYRHDELKFETKELPEVNIDDLVLTLDKIPLYQNYLRPNGFSEGKKISDDFKKFWQEDIDRGIFF